MSKDYISNMVLTLFLTEGMSLKEWDRIGLLQREMALYVRLVEHGVHVQIFSWGDVGDLYYEQMFSGIKVLIVPYYQKNPTFKNRIHLFRATRTLKKSDVFKSNQIQGSDVALEYGARFGIPVITRCGYLWSQFTQRQTSDPELLNRAVELERAAFTNAHAGITSSPRDRDYVTREYGLVEGKVTCVPNYVDQTVFSATFEGREEGHLLYVGRLSPQKNLPALLSAVDKSKFVKKLTLIGHGELHKELSESALKISKEVEFLGTIPNHKIAEYMKTCTAYILPSFYEGLPKTLLEAMSCGCACIGTDVEGIREVLSNGVTGVLCTTDESSIMESIDSVFNDDSLRVKLGKAASSTIDKTYSLNKVLELEKQVYQKVLLIRN